MYMPKEYNKEKKSHSDFLVTLTLVRLQTTTYLAFESFSTPHYVGKDIFSNVVE